MGTIERAVHEGVGPNGIDVRLYDDTSRPQVPKLPSVTTILKTRDDDKSNLYDWQDRNDGTGNNAHHEHLFWYSRHVGTLGHWYALNELDPALEWTEDEEQSERELYRMFEEEVEDDSPREVLYSILRGDRDKEGGIVSTWGEFYDRYPPYKNGDYYRNALVERAEKDIEFFKDGILRLWNKLGISPLNTISVEQYLFNDEYGYAGQVDLVYEDADGYTVVADLKSSSGCYDKHQIQGAAYAKSVEVAGIVDESDGSQAQPSVSESLAEIQEVDRLEVHRAHPRTGQMAAHTHRDAPGKQSIHTTKYWNDSIDALWQDFESLIQNFEGYDWSEQ